MKRHAIFEPQCPASILPDKEVYHILRKQYFVLGGLPYKSIRGLRVLRVDRKDTVNKEGGLTNRKDDCRPLWSS